MTWPRRPAGQRPAVLAHRGGTGPWRENSVEAFTGARALGADGVELDVRRAGDGALAVVHDPAIPTVGPIHAISRKNFPDWLPTLGEALDACAGLDVNVEIKNSPRDPGHDPDQGVAAAVAAVVAGADAPRHVVVSSFDPATVAAVRAANGDVPTALLVHPLATAAEALATATALGCVAVHPFVTQVDAALVAAAHQAGLAVCPWTVNRPDDLAGLAAAGVDAVITDEVALALATVGAR